MTKNTSTPRKPPGSPENFSWNASTASTASPRSPPHRQRAVRPPGAGRGSAALGRDAGVQGVAGARGGATGLGTRLPLHPVLGIAVRIRAPRIPAPRLGQRGGITRTDHTAISLPQPQSSGQTRRSPAKHPRRGASVLRLRPVLTAGLDEPRDLAGGGSQGGAGVWRRKDAVRADGVTAERDPGAARLDDRGS